MLRILKSLWSYTPEIPNTGDAGTLALSLLCAPQRVFQCSLEGQQLLAGP